LEGPALAAAGGSESATLPTSAPLSLLLFVMLCEYFNKIKILGNHFFCCHSITIMRY
jgi:hypothetical protein